MKKRNKEEIQKRMAKSEVWCEDVCDQAMSQKFGVEMRASKCCVRRNVAL